MANSELSCWHCGGSLAALPLPLGRREECPHCASWLHVCRMCDFYDPNTSKQCREPVADEVTDKEAANFCDYFRPRAGLQGQSDEAAEQARSQLQKLFGEGAPTKGPGEAKPGSGSAERPSEAEAARDKLSKLFDDRGD